MVRPSCSSIRRSRSVNRHPLCRDRYWPTVLFPAPMKPMRKTAGSCSLFFNEARTILPDFYDTKSFQRFLTRILPLKELTSTLKKIDLGVPLKMLPRKELPQGGMGFI